MKLNIELPSDNPRTSHIAAHTHQPQSPQKWRSITCPLSAGITQILGVPVTSRSVTGVRTKVATLVCQWRTRGSRTVEMACMGKDHLICKTIQRARPRAIQMTASDRASYSRSARKPPTRDAVFPVSSQLSAHSSAARTTEERRGRWRQRQLDVAAVALDSDGAHWMGMSTVKASCGGRTCYRLTRGGGGSRTQPNYGRQRFRSSFTIDLPA